MKILVHGPNLSGRDQSKGTFHVHASDCGVNGRLQRYTREKGWAMDVSSRKEIVVAIYGEFEEFEDSRWTDYDDLHVCPCVSFDEKPRESEYARRERLLARAEDILHELVAAHPEHAENLKRVRLSFNARRTTTIGWCASRWIGRELQSASVEFAWKVFREPANEAVFEDVVRHELAHAADADRSGHGASWKRLARLFGADPSRTCDDLPVSVHKPKRQRRHEVACARCGGVYTVSTRKRNNMMRELERGAYRVHRGCGGRILLANNDED